MECPACTFQNIPGTPRCVRCQSLLDLDRIDVEPPRARFGSGIVRRLLRARHAADRGVDRLRQRLSTVLAAVPKRVSGVRFIDLALSILPGVAHLNRGERGLGLTLLLAWLVLILGSMVLAGSVSGMLLFTAAIGLHGAAVALVIQPAIWFHSLLSRVVLGMLVFAMLYTCLYMPARMAIGWVATPMAVTGIRSTPELTNGDVVLYRAWHAPDRRTRGELVAYRIHAANGGSVYVAAGLGIDRIIGLPGDHVEIIDSQVFVNGNAVPPARAPMGVLRQMNGVSFTVRDGHYGILPSLLQLRAGGTDSTVRRPLLRNVSMVHQDDVLGPVQWRLRPFSRCGRID